MSLPDVGPGVADQKVAEQVEIQAKYAGYIDRQSLEIEKHLRHEQTRLPADLDYVKVPGLSTEVCQKLNAAEPVATPSGKYSRIFIFDSQFEKDDMQCNSHLCDS